MVDKTGLVEPTGTQFFKAGETVAEVFGETGECMF
jgi:hypothetical protein